MVEKDQLLLKIDETRATSGVRESAAQGYALRARQARLRALAEGAAFQPPGAAGDNADEKRIVEEERRLYETRLSELNTMLAINQQQLQQRQQELSEMRSRKTSAERSLDLSQQRPVRCRKSTSCAWTARCRRRAEIRNRPARRSRVCRRRSAKRSARCRKPS